MKQKSAIVTGASRGIGRAISKYLGGKGYNLLLISRSLDLLESLRSELTESNLGIHIQIAAVDISNEVAIESCIAEFLSVTNSIDLVFNNAGYVKRGTSEIDRNELEAMININLIGAINVVKSVVPRMKCQKSGYIMNVCSRNAEVPRPFLGGYAASKAALLAYSESLYKELKNENIKVTAICPGFVDTDMTKDVNESREKLIMLDDMCAAVGFLLSLSPAAALKKLSFESVAQVGEYC